MISNFNVPNPCSESWNGMQPQENGRYCGSCQKVVIDFTNKTNEEILAYIAANSGRKMCGTFRKSQLPPKNASFKNEHTIRFLAAALFVFGMTLFSCNTPEPEQQQQEVSAPPVMMQPPNANDPAFLPADSTKPKVITEEEEEEYPVPEVKLISTDESTITGDINVPEPVIMPEPPPQPVPALEPLVVGMVAGDMPEFIGGDRAMKEYISDNIDVQGEIKSGTVYVSFVVKADGSIADVKLLRGLSPEQDAEAVRVVKSMPKWKPALQNGKPVDVKFNLPIKFRSK